MRMSKVGRRANAFVESRLEAELTP